MKKTIFTIGIITIFTLSFFNTRAQNSLDLKWGVFMPDNGNTDKALSNSQAFSIGLLHPINDSHFSAGITFSHQHYHSKDAYFKPEYSSHVKIHNYLLTARYDFFNQGDFKLYTSAEAGLNKTENAVTQNSSVTEIKNLGFTTVISLGVDLKITRRLLIGANIQGQYNYTNTIQFEDKLTLDHLTGVACNIGLRFLLGTKK